MNSNLSATHFNITTANGSIWGCNELKSGIEWYLYIPCFILLVWSFTLIIMILLPIFCCFLHSKPPSGKSNKNVNGDLALWYLGSLTAVFYVVREILDMTANAIGLITLNWCLYSTYWIVAFMVEFFFIVGDPFNCLFYVYRLYTVHSKPGTN